MATTNTTAYSWKEWAAALTEEQLAARLHMLAESLKDAKPAERAAILTESASRLGWPAARKPKLGNAPALKLGETPAPAGPATPAADAADQEVPAGRAPRRRKTGDPRTDRKSTAA